MFLHSLEYINGSALVLQGESMKAGAYVTHNASLGVLREKMLARLIRSETPDRFRVETGLIRMHDHKPQSTSRQCDLLIHEATARPPLYRWEDFVIVHAENARAVIEMKSIVNQDAFEETMKVLASVASTAPDCLRFGYALGGVSFKSFLGYVVEQIKANPLNFKPGAAALNLPVAFAVQQAGYIGLRPVGSIMPDEPRKYYLLVDFNKIKEADRPKSTVGIETGLFLAVYGEVLNNPAEALAPQSLYGWFNNLPMEEGGKLWVDTDGQVNDGSIPGF